MTGHGEPISAEGHRDTEAADGEHHKTLARGETFHQTQEGGVLVQAVIKHSSSSHHHVLCAMA